MTEIVDKQDKKIDKHPDSLRITIPDEYGRMADLEPEDEIEIGLLDGKHGRHIGIWKKGEQPNEG